MNDREKFEEIRKAIKFRWETESIELDDVIAMVEQAATAESAARIAELDKDALRELLMKVAQEVDRQYRGQSQPMTLEAIVGRVMKGE